MKLQILRGKYQLNSRIESVWITKQKHHHGLHRIRGCVAVIAGWRSHPTLLELLLDRSRRRQGSLPILSVTGLCIPLPARQKNLQNYVSKMPTIQTGRSKWVSSMTPCCVHTTREPSCRLPQSQTGQHIPERDTFSSQGEKQIQIQLPKTQVRPCSF